LIVFVINSNLRGGDLCFLPFNINGDLRKIPSLLFKTKEKYLKTKQNKLKTKYKK
jgi:hypothetical protein